MKLALKLLLRRKAYTAISLFGITLTLLVLVVATAIADGVVGAAPPQSAARRMLFLLQVRVAEPGGSSRGPLGWDLLQRTVRDLPEAAGVTVLTRTMSADAWAGDVKLSVAMKGTDAAFWSVHDIRFVEGAPYGEADDADGRAVAVISEGTRRRLFGGSPALGREIEMASRRYRVCGVARDVSSMRFVPHADAWVPLASLPGSPARGTGLRGDLAAVVVARDRSAVPRLRRLLEERLAAVPLESSEQTLTAHVDTLAGAVARKMIPEESDGTSGEPLPKAIALLGALTAAFLALPVLNMVNLGLSRIFERAPEIGVRKAFGATPRRLVVQLVAENVVLVLAGGLLAALAAPVVLAAVVRSGMLPGADLAMSVPVLAGGLFFAILLGVLSGAWPAWRMARMHPIEALRGRAR